MQVGSRTSPRWLMVGAATLGMLVAGCSSGGDSPDAQGRITVQGTVHSVQASDGTQCWKFSSAKGKDYELQPAQVPVELLVDGQQVTLVAKPRSGGGSFCKVGTIIDVVTVNPEAPAQPKG
jgi:hypothetical protein